MATVGEAATVLEAKEETSPILPRKHRGKKDRVATKNLSEDLIEINQGQDDNRQLKNSLVSMDDDATEADAAKVVANMNTEEHLQSNNDNNDKGFLKRLAEGATKRAKNVGDKVLLLRDMLEMHCKGVLKLKAWEVGIIVSCLAYVLNPIDVVLDAMPGGFLDDVLVLGAAVHRLDASISKFQRWKQENPVEFQRGKALSWFGNKNKTYEDVDKNEDEATATYD